MPITTPAQLLLAIAAREKLEATCAALGIDREQALALLQGAAKALQEQGTPARAHAAPRSAGTPPAPPPEAYTQALPPRALPRPGRKPTAAELERAADALLSGAGPHARAVVASSFAAAPSAMAGKAARPPAERASPPASLNAPLPSRVVVYSDGASRGNPGPGGAGAVIADPSGRILRRLGRFLGRVTNNIAEYEGVLLGLRGALEGGAREVTVRADSELAIRQLDGVYRVKNAALLPLFNEARALLGRFDKVTLQHVPRAQNAAADEMSNRAIDEKL